VEDDKGAVIAEILKATVAVMWGAVRVWK